DLRAPLRSIRSFSGLLEEESQAVLNEAAQNYLMRIGSAAKRMDELIDAWLQLSRIARGQMRWESTDLTALASSLMVALRHIDSNRAVEFTCGQGLLVRGDPSLLRILLENLLGNAWKFSAKVPNAQIEFGLQRHNGNAPVHFVRDNGAGFEMK